jgi:hypothetical protein
MTGYGLAGRFDLPSGDPGFLKRLDPERSEGKLVSALGIPFHLALLLLPVFGLFWL